MVNQIYTIRGRVIEARSGKGLQNMAVEAWDKDVKYNDLLGQTFTNDDGGFTLSFDSTYFREFAPDEKPDLLFKVFLGKRPMKIKGDNIVFNAGINTEVTLTIEMPEMRPEGKDRLSSNQAFKVNEFLRQSDFKGVYNEFRKKADTSFGFMADMVANTISKMDLKPIRVGNTRTENVVGQDVTTATDNLQNQHITVNEVKEYNPGVNRESLKDIAAFPVQLREGQKVNLHVENGTVKYYSLVEEIEEVKEKIHSKNKEQTENIGSELSKDDDLIKVTEELNITRKKAEEKDHLIEKLQQEMEMLRKDHEEIKTLLNSDAIKQLISRPVTQKKPK